MAPANLNIHQCRICKQLHSLRFCQRFLAMPIERRRRAVRMHGYCINCLARSHSTPHCTSVDVCQRCGRDHHTLLHLNTAQPTRVSETTFRQRSPQRQHKQRRPQLCPNSQHHRQRQQPHRQQQRRQQTQQLNVNTRNRQNNRFLDQPSFNTRRIIRDIVKALEELEKDL